LALVHTLYIHGMPPSLPQALGPGAVRYLEEVLEDTTAKKYWFNAAAMTGDIGSKRSFRVLRRFVWNRFRGPVDGATLRALIIAQSSMSGIVPEVEPRAEEYLWHGANPAYWDSLPWLSGNRTRRDMGVILSQISITSLGWIGSKRCEDWLEALSKRPFHPRQRGTIAEALAHARGIRRMGREAYFRAREADAERKRNAVPVFPYNR
jgi:hypothetical protein